MLIYNRRDWGYIPSWEEGKIKAFVRNKSLRAFKKELMVLDLMVRFQVMCMNC